MYQIALCDDERTELEKTEKLLADFERLHPGLNLMPRCFDSAGELLDRVREENYMPDLIFMDIFMSDWQGRSCPVGMQAAKKLRSMNYKGKLVFLTASNEYALDAYEVDAIQYMVKPVPDDKFFVVLSRLLQDIEAERGKYVVLRVGGRLVRVPVNEIVYCEAQKKMQCLYLSDGTCYTLRMTMGEMYEMLSQYPEFVRLGVAFVVNLVHVSSLNAKEVEMDTGEKIYLPRGRYKKLKEEYFNFFC